MTAVLVTEEVAAKLIKARARNTKHPVIINSQPVPDCYETVSSDGVGTLHHAPTVTEPAGRALADIEKDLGVLVKAQRRNIFTMGALLIEAKARVLHGEWLPWLQQHFGRSVSTAENYMNAARLIAKFPTVGNLKLSNSALYWLAGIDDHVPPSQWAVDYRNTERSVMPLILEVAKTAYVDRKYIDEALGRQQRKQTAAKGVATRDRNKANGVKPGKPPCAWEQHVLDAPPVLPRPSLISAQAIDAARPEAQALGIVGSGPGGKTKQQAQREFKATLSPEELTAFNHKLELHGHLRGNVKAICRLAPNLADLFDVSIDNDRLVEASAVLLALVAMREAIARGDDPMSATGDLVAALRAANGAMQS